MKKSPLIIAMLSSLALMACSSTKVDNVSNGTNIPPGPQQAISEQKLANDFKRQGVRVIYSLFGNLEAIETTGYAPVWGSSQNAAREAFRVAELEAKKSLNDFINQETIRSSVSVRMVSKNIEKARDRKANNFSTNRDNVTAVTGDDEITDGDRESGSNQNTATRDDALNIASRVNTNINIRAQGILGGLYLVDGTVINDGRTVKVVYRWDLKHNESRKTIRGLMTQ